jgi:hypothetical protein
VSSVVRLLSTSALVTSTARSSDAGGPAKILRLPAVRYLGSCLRVPMDGRTHWRRRSVLRRRGSDRASMGGRSENGRLRGAPAGGA